jgi:hypothetical protein
MLPGAKHIWAGIAGCAIFTGCSFGGQIAPSGAQFAPASGPLLASTGTSRVFVRELARGDCKPVPAALRGAGGVYTFRTVEGIRAKLAYASNTLGKSGSQSGYIESCTQPLGGNTPNVPAGFSLDWEGIVSTDGRVDVSFDDAKLFMTFAGSGLNALTHYTLFVFSADRQFNWDYAQTIPLGAPLKRALSTPSLFEGGYDLAGSGLFFILAH